MKTVPNNEFFALVEEALAENGAVRIPVKGCSMFPMIRSGKDEVMLAAYKGEYLRRNDVLLFRYRGRHILHRIVGERDGGFVMRGDNALNTEFCRKEDVVGKVTAVFRKQGDSFRESDPCGMIWLAGRLLARAHNLLRSTVSKLIHNG